MPLKSLTDAQDEDFALCRVKLRGKRRRRAGILTFKSGIVPVKNIYFIQFQRSYYDL